MGAKRDERVQRGIQHLLDTINGGMGGSWNQLSEFKLFAKVDLEILDQLDSSKCVVSQLLGSKFGTGGYYVGLSLLGLSTRDAHEYGYDVDSSDYYDSLDGKDHKYPDKLTKAWVKAIKEIRGDT
jgi:hypothetical protein